jgi:hypothetical protein
MIIEIGRAEATEIFSAFGQKGVNAEDGDVGRGGRRARVSCFASSRRRTPSGRKAYGAVCDAPLLGYVDQLLPAIEAEFSDDKVRLTEVACLFEFKAPRREPVQFGILLLGFAGSACNVDALRTIGACDEFTLFDAVGIQNLLPYYERDSGN